MVLCVRVVVMSSASAEPRRRLPFNASSSSLFSGRQEQSHVSAAHFFRAKNRHRPNPSLPDLSVETTSRREEMPPKKKTKSKAPPKKTNKDGRTRNGAREETNEYGEATFLTHLVAGFCGGATDPIDGKNRQN